MYIGVPREPEEHFLEKLMLRSPMSPGQIENITARVNIVADFSISVTNFLKISRSDEVTKVARTPSAFTDQSGERYEGAFFPRAHNFVLNGGHFQSFTHINQATTNATDFANFRRIAMGDIVLQECRAVIKPPPHLGFISSARVWFTPFSRPSARRLCIELSPTGNYLVELYLSPSRNTSLQQTFPSRSWFGPPDEEQIVAEISLRLSAYHDLCRSDFSVEELLPPPQHSSVRLGGVYRCVSGRLHEEVAFTCDKSPRKDTRDEIDLVWINNPVDVPHDAWSDSAKFKKMLNEWIRVPSERLINQHLVGYQIGLHDIACYTWLSQVNHVFSRLNSMAAHSEYVFVYGIRLEVHILHLKLVQPPVVPSERKAFLFMCLPASFLSSDRTRIEIPERVAYWSFDPSGAQPLTNRDALQSGLPVILPSITVFGKSFDRSVYAGLRQFHQGKGFDPESQDVARHEGHSLFGLSTEQKVHKSASHINHSVDHDPNMKPGATTTFSETGRDDKFILCFLAVPIDDEQGQAASHINHSTYHDPNVKPKATTTDNFSGRESDDEQILYPRLRRT
ncbi:hypothetical protein C8R45DRAFT_946404 [Mycena sanguinolenta]|nr:hypothetical protein C8R45DRAFT_946404 [Mycena sanguinolenta]